MSAAIAAIDLIPRILIQTNPDLFYLYNSQSNHSETQQNVIENKEVASSSTESGTPSKKRRREESATEEQLQQLAADTQPPKKVNKLSEYNNTYQGMTTYEIFPEPSHNQAQKTTNVLRFKRQTNKKSIFFNSSPN